VHTQRIITLITDFGDKSGYVGVMKGVILSTNPDCRIVDITHQISPQDREEAAFVLKSAYPFFPPETIHLVVVDPGVGSIRKPILIEAGTHWFVGPDNGVLSFAFLTEECKEVREITNTRYFLPRVSSTFHGRDIFAPVAAHLSLGVPAHALGEELKHCVLLEALEPEILEGVIKARVVYADHFGNVISNISYTLFNAVVADKPFRITIGETVIETISPSYADAREGEIIALFGSSQQLEIAVRNGNCQRTLQIEKGAEISVSLLR
jgi:S-adenosylmethionine hydrolase